MGAGPHFGVEIMCIQKEYFHKFDNSSQHAQQACNSLLIILKTSVCNLVTYICIPNLNQVEFDYIMVIIQIKDAQFSTSLQQINKKVIDITKETEMETR